MPAMHDLLLRGKVIMPKILEKWSEMSLTMPAKYVAWR